MHIFRNFSIMQKETRYFYVIAFAKRIRKCGELIFH